MTNVVLTHLLTALSDPQTGERWEPVPEVLQTLSESVQSLSDARLVILSTDPLVTASLGDAEIVLVQQTISPYVQRWLETYRYLREHPEIEFVWCVDGTDVQMMRNPFPEMKPDHLYVGCEDERTDNRWMRNHFKGALMDKFFRKYGKYLLLNAGIIGGSRDDVMAFAHRMVSAWEDSEIDAVAKEAKPSFVRRGVTDRDLNSPVLDMGMFNLVARTNFPDKISFGSHVNTRFKGYDYENTTGSWWRHK